MRAFLCSYYPLSEQIKIDYCAIRLDLKRFPPVWDCPGWFLRVAALAGKDHRRL